MQIIIYEKTNRLRLITESSLVILLAFEYNNQLLFITNYFKKFITIARVFQTSASLVLLVFGITNFL